MSTADLLAHLRSAHTEVCRCWAVTRRDGRVLGFTDHDMPLTFDGINFRADSGLSAKAISQTTGLSVDNTEAVGALSDPAITEADIVAGRYDGAGVRAWLVQWSNPDARVLQFRGTIGELRRGSGAFHAELRGLTEALNQAQGRSYQRMCTAVLGDTLCRFDLTADGYREERAVGSVDNAQVFRFPALDTYDPRWFERGHLTMLDGVASGLSGVIKHDRFDATGTRVIELWAPLGAVVTAGDVVRLDAGCDKRRGTCRLKFDNLMNFRGFPDIPGEDWLVSIPVRSGDNDGGSLNR
jgi:uncharacterized phage protein (TIGR02218 family)